MITEYFDVVQSQISSPDYQSVSCCKRESKMFSIINGIIHGLRAARQLRPLRHHIYRGAVVGVRGAAVGARGAVVGARGAAVGNIGMHTYIRHICAPVHLQVLRARTDLHHFTSERFHYISKTDLHHLHW